MYDDIFLAILKKKNKKKIFCFKETEFLMKKTVANIDFLFSLYFEIAKCMKNGKFLFR